MEILVLTGSPHVNGTSATLAAEFIRGAKDAGHTVTVFDSARRNLRPCLGCGRCGMDGDCIQPDEGNELMRRLLASDGVVFVTPVYYFGMSAQLKAVVDRFYARNGKITAKKLRAALIAAAWNDDDVVMSGLEKHFEIIFDYLDFDNRGFLLARGAGAPSMIKKRYLTEAYEMGRNF